MKKPTRRTARAPRRLADSGIDQAVVDWNNHNAYRSGSLRALIDAGLVAWGHGGWAPTKAGRQKGLNPNHLEASEQRRTLHDRPETSWEKWKRAVINDLERSVSRLEATRIFDRYRHEMAVRFRNGEKPSDVAYNFLNVWKNEPPHMREPRHVVRDFNTLDDLIAHAARELGATHVLFVDEEIHVYFPRRDGTFEKAEIWQKDGYWHAQGPGARTIVQKVPTGAEPIGQQQAPSRRAAEARRRWEDVPYEELLSLAHAHKWGPERDAAQAELVRRRRSPRRAPPAPAGAGHGLEWHRYKDSLVGTVNGERRFLLDPTADGDWILWAVDPKTGFQTHKLGRFGTSSEAQDAARFGRRTHR